MSRSKFEVTRIQKTTKQSSVFEKNYLGIWSDIFWNGYLHLKYSANKAIDVVVLTIWFCFYQILSFNTPLKHTSWIIFLLIWSLTWIFRDIFHILKSVFSICTSSKFLQVKFLFYSCWVESIFFFRVTKRKTKITKIINFF